VRCDLADGGAAVAVGKVVDAVVAGVIRILLERTQDLVAVYVAVLRVRRWYDEKESADE
jgi:hypothetical protein